MIRLDDVIVVTPQITPIEVRVLVVATWKIEVALGPPLPKLRLEDPRSEPPMPTLRLQGQVVGPHCEYAETLTSRMLLRSENESGTSSTYLRASAQILEPCFWEPQHPFCYEIQVELYGPDGLVDMRRIVHGIRHVAIEQGEFVLNGQPHFIQGIRRAPSASATELEAWHAAGCSAWLMSAPRGLCDRLNRWGPMLMHLLPAEYEAARAQIIELRNLPSIGMWVVASHASRNKRTAIAAIVRSNDRTRHVAMCCDLDSMQRGFAAVDLRILPVGHPEIGAPDPRAPYIVVAGDPSVPPDCKPSEFAGRIAEMRDQLGLLPGLVGVIL